MVVFWCPEEELLADDRSPHTSLLDVCPGDPSPSTHRRRDSSRHNGPGKRHTDLNTLTETVQSVVDLMELEERFRYYMQIKLNVHIITLMR